jgi:hypothetical protein
MSGLGGKGVLQTLFVHDYVLSIPGPFYSLQLLAPPCAVRTDKKKNCVSHCVPHSFPPYQCKADEEHLEGKRLSSISDRLVAI